MGVTVAKLGDQWLRGIQPGSGTGLRPAPDPHKSCPNAADGNDVRQAGPAGGGRLTPFIRTYVVTNSHEPGAYSQDEWGLGADSRDVTGRTGFVAYTAGPHSGGDPPATRSFPH
ncbi:hypothetical protein GCM10010170_048870 [Dactylosporangium salmoneum]|uniref:Uncharacterized protein n=1 Tax=Dactylosporangium salmoneum TaxID=53361 RepID=A0ABP5TLP0_9ACTN